MKTLLLSTTLLIVLLSSPSAFGQIFYTISGNVTDSSGNALAHIRVELWDTDNYIFGDRMLFDGYSDTKGHYGFSVEEGYDVYVKVLPWMSLGSNYGNKHIKFIDRGIFSSTTDNYVVSDTFTSWKSSTISNISSSPAFHLSVLRALELQ